MMKIWIKFFFFIFLSFSLQADEIVIGDGPPLQEVGEVLESTDSRLEEYLIDYRNRAGSHLIFDCRRKYFACVDELSKNNCQDRRGFAKSKEKKDLDCAFFKTYSSKKECILAQYKLVENKKRDYCFKKNR